MINTVIQIIILVTIRTVQLFSVMLSVAWSLLLRKVCAVNSYCSQSKQLIMLYYIMTYKSVVQFRPIIWSCLGHSDNIKFKIKISNFIKIEISL